MSDLNYNVNAVELNKAVRGKTAELTLDGKSIQYIRDFTVLYPNLKTIPPKLLYDIVIKDISTLPVLLQLQTMIEDDYKNRFKLNLNALYNHAPASFKKLIDVPALYDYYQRRFYLYILMDYINEHEIELEKMQNIDKYIEWIRPRNDPNIKYYIAGPKENSVFDVEGVVEHYLSIIDPNVTVSDLTNYLQLATQQTMSSTAQETLAYLQQMPNVYTKNPNEQCKYLLSIDSASGVLVTTDSNNNLVFDCSNVSLGELDDNGINAKIHDIQVSNRPRGDYAKLNIKSIRDLFNHYGRIKIINLTFTDNTFISSLNIYQKVFVIFQGVACDERAIYNTANAPYLKIGGFFKKTSRGYEFESDSNAVTYKPARVDVKDFKIYITTDPGKYNKIIPNQYTLKIDKSKIYQHPYKTNLKANQAQEVRLEDYSYTDAHTTNTKISNETMYIINAPEELRSDVYSIIAANTFAVNDSVEVETVTITIKFLRKLLEHVRAIIVCLDTVLSKVELTQFSNYIDNNVRNYFENLNKIIDSFIKRETAVPKTNPITTDESQAFLKLMNGYSINNVRKFFTTLISGLATTYNFENISRNVVESVDLLVSQVDGVNVCNQYRLHLSADTFNQIQPNTQQHVDTLYNSDLKTDVNVIYNAATLLYRNVPIDTNVPFIEWIHHLQCVFDIYYYMSKLFIYSSTDFESKTVTEMKTVQIDTVNGMIDKKYFRMVNGIPVFEDEHGEPYTTPDRDYLIYPEEDNDLMLYNLYNYYRNTITPETLGSYMYSFNLSSIQRIPYTLTDYSKIFNTSRFDNTYYIGDYAIVPNFVQADGESTLHWDDIERIYSHDIFKYIKIEQSFNNGTTNTKYLAINTKNNTITPSIEPNKVIAVYDSEHNYWIDTLETKDSNITLTGQRLTCAQLFNYNISNPDIKPPIITDTFDTHATDGKGSEITTIAILNKLGNDKMYRNYYEKIKLLTYNNEYIFTQTDITETMEMEYGLTLNTRHSIYIENLKAKFREDPLQYFDHLPINSLFLGDNSLVDVYFTGFVKLVYQDNWFLFNGTVSESTYGNTYLVTFQGQPGADNVNNLSRWEIRNITETDKHPIKDITFNDYFNNTMVLNSNIISSISDNIDDLDGKTFRIQDSNSNTITTVYKVNKYKTCIEIIVETTVKYIISTSDTKNITYIYHSNSGDNTISYESVLSHTNAMQKANTLITTNQLGMFCDETIMYKQDAYDKSVNIFKSNVFSAFNIDGYNIISKYWNNEIYEYSLLHALPPFMPALVSVPHNINLDLTNDDETDVYTFNSRTQAIELLPGTYTITRDKILLSEDARTIKEFYVYRHNQEAYTYERDEDNYLFMESPINLPLINSLGETVLNIHIRFDANLETITKVELYAMGKYLVKDNTISGYKYTQELPVGAYDDNIISGIPFYITSEHAAYKCIIEYTGNKDVGVEFVNVSITETIDELIYYIETPEGVKQTYMPHIYADNIPGSDIKTSNTIMNLHMTSQQYRLHPYFAYIENSFVSPRYVNTEGNIITMLNVFNQNTQIMNVNVKAENTLEVSNDYNVGKILACNDKHVVESLNDYMLMISDFDKRQDLKQIAIETEYIHVIPVTSRMTISLEFS